MKFLNNTKKLFPPLDPFDTGYIKKGVHSIYYEQCGNPKGKPAIFLHGGPGGGAGKLSRRFFDPKKYHLKVIIKSAELKKMNQIEVHKKIFSILKEEMNSKIHALEIEII